MDRRTEYGRRREDFKWYKYFIHQAPKHVYVGLWIAGAVWGWNLFKYLEPSLFPVVTGFVIEEVQKVDGQQQIAGRMYKQRNCDFTEVVAYNGKGDLVDIEFLDVKQVVSRVEGVQGWGWWAIIPAVNKLALYSNHNCATGKVTTKLFEGVL